jgi:hypothetical protein
VLALFTDDLIRRLFTEEVLRDLAGMPVDAGTPEPLPAADQTVLWVILDVEVLAPGRVGAFVLVDTAFDPLAVEVNYYVLVETEAGWLIDEIVCFDAFGGFC